MSGFKFKKVLTILAWVLVALLCFYISYYVYPEKKPEKLVESYPHSLSIYTAEGDTLLDMDTESEYVKIWVEENGELDIWTLEENGWKRN